MLFIILLVLGILCFCIGHARGVKSKFELGALFVLGAICFPAGLILSLVCSVGASDTMDCPQCAEAVKRKALVCWRCGLDLFEWRRRNG